MNAFFKSEHVAMDDGRVELVITFSFDVDRKKDIHVFSDAYGATCYLLQSKRDWIASMFDRQMKIAARGHKESGLVKLTHFRVAMSNPKFLQDLPKAIVRESDEIHKMMCSRSSGGHLQLADDFLVLVKYCQQLLSEYQRAAKHFSNQTIAA